MFQHSAPRSDYAQPELRALLDRGVEPLKAWIRTLTSAHPELGFHATSEWDNTVLACYLSHFLPRLPPTGYWQQDVLVIHQPEHWQNGEYNRIFTQMSGNCLIPDVFHEFLLALTRTFGKRFIPVWELIYWLEHQNVPDQAILEQDLSHNQRLFDAIAFVEAQEGGVIDRSTICILNPFTSLEWMGMLAVTLHGHQLFRALHVKGDQVSLFGGGSQDSEAGRWFDEMRDRAYFSRYRSRVYRKREEDSQSLPLVTADGHTIVLTGPFSDAQVVGIAEAITEAQENRAIVTFLEEIWGDVETIACVQFGTVASVGEETISSCQVSDKEGAMRLPQLDLPFWQELLGKTPPLKDELDACESDEARLDVLNEFLWRGAFFKDYALPDPKGEHPVFQRKVSLRSLPLAYPQLYTAH